MSKKIKIGIVGVGSIAENHIQSYLKNENVELYAFCDIDENRLKEKAEKYNVKHTFKNYHDMFAKKEIDAVSVCVWNSEHSPVAVAALDAGKHVLCEKPMAASTAAAIKMKEAADRSGKRLMIGFVRRFGNDTKVIQDFINNDFLGEIYYAKATYLRRNGNPGGWFGNKELSAGGPLIDLGVHVIDLSRYLMGNPKPVSVYGVTFQKLFDRPDIKDKKGYIAESATDHDIVNVEDLASALVRYDNGSVLSIEASFSLNIKNDVGMVELMGTKAGARLNPELEIFTDQEGHLVNISFDKPTALDFNGLFEAEINHYVDCLLDENLKCISPPEDGIEVMRIIDAIYESAAKGHEVIL